LQEYDVALKLLLRLPGLLALQELVGARVETWMDAEIPRIQNLRADLLGRAADGSLIHLELQSSNDGIMALRMAEYALGIFRLYRQFPRQVLVYVGEAPLRMKTELRGPDFLFHYRAVDIRTLDGDQLLESTAVGDNVIAILTGLRDHKEAVRRIVERIAGLPGAQREASLSQLLVLSGLRHLEESVEQEARKMPILNSILDNKVLGREYKRGLQDGELTVLHRQVEKKFGPLPSWAEERLAGRSTTELEELSIRVLDAASLEDLLK
jgi:Domain of unknown function (DUF4351)